MTSSKKTKKVKVQLKKRTDMSIEREQESVDPFAKSHDDLSEIEVNGKATLETTAAPKVVKQDSTDDTLFIRNLSFDTDEENLKKFIESNFGETIYCLICKDKETDESKGTAFVKFKTTQQATKCLEEFKDKELMTKFHLDGRNLIVLPALSREKVQAAKQKDKKKDKRNLNLSREGYVHPLSEEAKDLSKSDLEKRKALDDRKREQLKNLHNFVSDTRLCIHNLPPFVEDDKLKQIFLKSIKGDHPGAKIIECRVMRNKKGSGKLGTSKGFGFVAFSKHEHALAALRNINNNPDIFTKDKRPIVEFSIENLVALNKKKTRLVNSQRKNQAIKDKSNSARKIVDTDEQGNKSKKIGKAKNKFYKKFSH